jgi:hypothetical protein
MSKAYTEERNNYLTKINEYVGKHSSDPLTNTNFELLPPALKDYFSWENFADSSNVPSIDASSLTLSETSKDAIITALRTNNTTLDTYYNNIDGIDHDNVVSTAVVKDLALHITDYFVISSILYKWMYGNVMTYDVTLPPSSTDFSKVYEAFIEVTNNLNLDEDSSYGTKIADNIDLNNTFVRQDILLKAKENSFDKEKNNIITLMSKIHRQKKRYNRKRIWHTFYLVLLCLYAVLVMGFAYKMRGRGDMFLVISGALLFVTLLLHEVIKNIKYYFK